MTILPRFSIQYDCLNDSQVFPNDSQMVNCEANAMLRPVLPHVEDTSMMDNSTLESCSFLGPLYAGNC